MKYSVILTHTIFTMYLAQFDTSVIKCSGIAYLGSSAQITCSTSDNFNNTVYECPCGPAPQCTVSGCTPVSGYSASIVNQTQTELTINSVQRKHAGNWSCQDGDDRATFCHLVVAKIPSVNKTSDVDADSVNLGDRISLTVGIGDYHCSEAYGLTLQLGSVTYTSDTGRNATVKPRTRTVPINVRQAHFGDVTLVFVCGSHQWNITPEGVSELQQNRTYVPTKIPPKDVSTLLIVAGGVTSAVIIILIITIACCCCSCRKKVNPTETRQCSLPSESNTAYSEAGTRFQDVSKSNGINGSSESFATHCSVVTLRDYEDLHDSMENGGSIYDILFMN